MDTASGFYRVIEGQIQYAPNRVASPTILLKKQDKDTYNYPVEGWYWFDTYEAAEQAFSGSVENYSLLQTRINQMENACREYLELKGDLSGNSGRIHSTAAPMIFDKAKANKPKCLAIKTWVETCWGLYYQRLDILSGGGDWSETFLDFSVIGPIPYTIYDAMVE